MKRLLRLIGFIVIFFAAYILYGEYRAGAGSPPALFYIALFVTLFAVFLTFTLKRAMREQMAFEVRPLSPDAVSAAFRARVADFEQLGFRPLGAPVVHVGRLQIRLQGLIAPDGLSYAGVFEHGAEPKLAFDLDSKLADGRIVSTSSSDGAARAPVRPEVLIQVFPGATPTQLLKQHQEAPAALGSAYAPLAATTDGYLELCREASRRQFEKTGVLELLGAYVRSQSPHLVAISARPRS